MRESPVRFQRLVFQSATLSGPGLVLLRTRLAPTFASNHKRQAFLCCGVASLFVACQSNGITGVVNVDGCALGAWV